jgi:hypothetical protein
LRKNHIGTQAAPSSSWATFAAARFGAVKMPSRTNGSRRLAWTAVKTASSTTATAPTSSVEPARQPTSGARTIA